MDQVKERIGEVAASLVQDGMLVGLGTGSTANCFIQALAKRYHEEGIVIATVSSSYSSERLARESGLPFVTIDAISEIDITFDGADEIDSHKRMIKGRGGALLKEKILASHSKDLVIMVEDTKWVDALGIKAQLPVEVIQFGYLLTARKLFEVASSVKLRLRADNRPFITESGHFIMDLELKTPIENYEALSDKIQDIAGVVETGFFFGLTPRVITGYADSSVRIS